MKTAITHIIISTVFNNHNKILIKNLFMKFKNKINLAKI